MASGGRIHTPIYWYFKEDEDRLRYFSIASKEGKKFNFWAKELIKEAVNIKYPKNSTKNNRVLTWPNAETPHQTTVKKVRMMTDDILKKFENESGFLHDKAVEELRKRVG